MQTQTRSRRLGWCYPEPTLSVNHLVRLFLLLGLSLCASFSSALDAGEKASCASHFSDDDNDILENISLGTEIYLSQNGELPGPKNLSLQIGLTQKKIKEILSSAYPDSSFGEGLASLMLENSKTQTKFARDVHKAIKAFLLSNYRFPSRAELEETAAYPKEFFDLAWTSEQDLINSFLEENRSVLTRVRKKMIDTYATESKRRGRSTPLSAFLTLLGLPADLEEAALFTTDLGLFESYTELGQVAEKIKPRHFIDVISDDQFNDERLALFLSQLKKSKRLIHSTAIAGAEVDQDFLAALEVYCKKENAILVIIPADRRTFRLDEALLTSDWIFPIVNEVEYSPYLRVANARVMAKNFDPLTSLDRVGPRGQSVVVGSPKMFARVVPTVRNRTHPHIMTSTGAVTRPDSYQSEIYRSQRGDYIAQNDHVMGALILELQSSEALAEQADLNPYHMRHIEYKPDRQGFVDLDTLYLASGEVRKEAPLAIVLGDLHLGDLDLKAKEKAFELIKKHRPRTVVLHDSFNGHSVSHYTEREFLEKIRQLDEGRADLVAELRMHVDFLNELLALDPNLTIVDNVSNHNLWLTRWIQDRNFVSSSQNAKIGLLLATAMAVEGVENPLEFAATVLGTREESKTVFDRVVTDPNRVIFMRIGETTRESPRLAELMASESDLGLELGLHGDVGANGGKGSIKSLQKAEDVIIYGHSHTYHRRNRAINIGTMTELNLGYNRKGVGNWIQQLAIVGEHHEVQVLSFQNGEWHAGDQNKVSRKAFTSGYPHVKPLPAPTEAEQMDQYTRK